MVTRVMFGHKKLMGVYVKEELYNFFTQEAIRNNDSLSAYVNNLLTIYYDEVMKSQEGVQKPEMSTVT